MLRRLLFIILIFPIMAHAGITEDATKRQEVPTQHGIYDVFYFTAVSDGSGDIASTRMRAISGHLCKVDFILDETDTPATTSDIYINGDSTSVTLDLLGGSGVNVGADATDESVTPLVGGAYQCNPFAGDVYFVGDEMGATKTAIIKMWVLR